MSNRIRSNVQNMADVRQSLEAAASLNLARIYHESTSAPSTSDDIRNFDFGSIWIKRNLPPPDSDGKGDSVHICVDPTKSAAQWIELGSISGTLPITDIASAGGGAIDISASPSKSGSTLQVCSLNDTSTINFSSASNVITADVIAAGISFGLTDHAIARGNATGGIQDSDVTISDSGAVANASSYAYLQNNVEGTLNQSGFDMEKIIVGAFNPRIRALSTSAMANLTISSEDGFGTGKITLNASEYVLSTLSDGYVTATTGVLGSTTTIPVADLDVSALSNGVLEVVSGVLQSQALTQNRVIVGDSTSGVQDSSLVITGTQLSTASGNLQITGATGVVAVNGNLILNATGTGARLLQFEAGDSSETHVQLQAPTSLDGAASYTLTWPTNDGDDGQFMKVGASGVLSFATITEADIGDLGIYLEDAYASVTDGTATVSASGSDTFKLRTANSILTIVVDSDGTHGDNALFTIDQTAIDHDALLNFVSNEHVDHTSVTLTAGEGLTGGGDISANRTFDINWPELTAFGGTWDSVDLFAVYDSSIPGHRKATWGQLLIGLSAEFDGDYAPIGAKYIVQTADSDLTNEQALGALSTGILKNTTTTGVLSIAVAGTDYAGLASANSFTGVNLFGGGLGIGSTVTATLSTNQNNYAPTGIATCSVLRINTTADVTITGIQAPTSVSIGQTILLHHYTGAFNLVLADNSGSSSVGNRFSLNGDMTLEQDESVLLHYDDSSVAWRAVAGPTAAVTYTDEQAQDAVGGILVDSTEIDFTYADATPAITAEIIAASVALSKLVNASGSSKLVGSGDSGAGSSYTEITLGTNLTMSGTTLNASGGVSTHDLLDSSVHTDTVTHTAVLGDIIYANATPAWQALAGNTAATKKFLNQTGTGAASAAPSWDALVASDIPDLSSTYATLAFASISGDTGTATPEGPADSLTIVGGVAITTVAAEIPDTLTVNLDITELTDIGAVLESSDQIVVYDASATAHRKVAWSQIDALFADASHTHTSANITDFNEAAQDAVGGILTDSTELNFSYVDATPLITAVINANSVVVGRLAATQTDVFFGRDTAGAGAGEEITMAAAKVMLDLTGTNSGDQNLFSTINCPAGTDPAADSTTDTLNLASDHTGLTITGDSSTDTVTFDLVEANIDHNSLANLTTGDPHTQYLLESTFDANTILKADSDNTPVALTVGEQTLVGRITAGSIAALSIAQVKTLLDLAGSNTGDQTITLSGDVSGTGTGAITTTIETNAVEYTMLQQSSATGFAIIAKVSTGAGNYAELNAGTDSVLRRDGSGNLAFGTIDCNHIAGITALAQGDLIYGSASDTLALLNKNTSATRYLSNTGTSNNPAWAQVNLANGVTGDLPYANLTPSGSASRLLGCASTGAGDWQEISLGSSLTMSGTTLSVSTANVDHGGLGGLTDDDHTQYALLAGRSSGQTLIGGTAAGDDLTLQSTSNATKGTVFVGEAGDILLGDATTTARTMRQQHGVTKEYNLGNATYPFNDAWFQGTINIDADNESITFGADQDASILFNGTDTVLAPGGDLRVSGDVALNADNRKLLLGASDDASIYYNASDLVINPKEVGSGGVSMLGRLWLGGLLNLTQNYVVDDLTIDTGEITITNTSSIVYVDTQAAAASDDLDKINGGKVGDIILLLASDDAHTVVVKDDNDYLTINGGDFSLDNTGCCIWLLCASETPSSKWQEIGRVDFA